MQGFSCIQFFNNENTFRPNFRGQRLFNVTLARKINDDFLINIPAYFTKLDSFDTPLIADVYDRWYDTRFGEMICKNYFRKERGYRHSHNYDYFMIETAIDNLSEKKVKAIAEVKRNARVLELNFLQSRSELNERHDRVFGAGTMLLYGLCKYARQIRAKRIEFVSDSEKNDIWYKKLGFCQSVNSVFYLPRRKFSKFIRNIQLNYFNE